MMMMMTRMMMLTMMMMMMMRRMMLTMMMTGRMMNIYGKCLSWWLATYNAASQTPLAPIYSHHDDHHHDFKRSSISQSTNTEVLFL